MVKEVTVGQWRLSVNPDRCIASGLCAATAPEHFRLAGAHAEPVAELADPQEEAADAAESCPVEAITVREAATGLVIAPGG